MSYKNMTKADLLDMVNELENEVDSLQNGEFDECDNCSDLEMEIENLKEEVRQGEDRVEKLENEVNDLENNVSDLEDNQLDSSEIESISSDIADLGYRLDNMIP